MRGSPIDVGMAIRASLPLLRIGSMQDSRLTAYTVHVSVRRTHRSVHRTQGVYTEQRSDMQAITQDAYGSGDVLELTNVDKPEIGDTEVLVRVHAASIHVGDWI